MVFTSFGLDGMLRPQPLTSGIYSGHQHG